MQVSNESVLYIMPKQNILFPAVAHIKEIITDECKKKDEYGPVVIDGSHIYKIDSTTAKVRNGFQFQFPFSPLPFSGPIIKNLYSVAFHSSGDSIVDGRFTNTRSTINFMAVE